MNKDPSVFLQHILNCIQNIEQDTRGFSQKVFLRSRTIRDSVLRNLEIIGEATKNIPAEFRRKYPAVSWADLAGLRDKLIHDYLGVNLDIVWGVVAKELIPLRKAIQEILRLEETNKTTKR